LKQDWAGRIMTGLMGLTHIKPNQQCWKVTECGDCIING
jgi:hypothetical protein